MGVQTRRIGRGESYEDVDKNREKESEWVKKMKERIHIGSTYSKQHFVNYRKGKRNGKQMKS